MDHLQGDIESLENEKGELREKLKIMNKKTLYEAFSKTTPLQGIVTLIKIPVLYILVKDKSLLSFL